MRMSNSDKPEERGDHEVVRGVRDHAAHLVHEDRLDVRDNAAAKLLGQRTARLDVGEEPPRRLHEQDILHDRERDRRKNVMIVVARDEEDQEHRDILRDGHGGANVRDDIIAVVRPQHHAPIREEKVACCRVHEVDDVEYVQVDVGRRRSMHEAVKERQKGEPPKEYHRPHPAVDRAIKPEVGAEEFPVVVRDRLVHGAYDRRAEAKLREHQHAENRGEQSVQAQIGRPEQPQKERAVQERKQKLYAARSGIGKHVTLDVLLEVELHALNSFRFSFMARHTHGARGAMQR